MKCFQCFPFLKLFTMKLSSRQRLEVLKLIAADFSNAVIFDRLSKLNTDCEKYLGEIDHPFPRIGDSALSYYRKKFCAEIEELRRSRREDALNSGLALKAERIARLCAHADELELIKWEAGESGKLWNEKAWRETLSDIAEEMGDRKPKKEQGGEQTVKVYVGLDPDRV
jgi:hypothetical protein